MSSLIVRCKIDDTEWASYISRFPCPFHIGICFLCFLPWSLGVLYCKRVPLSLSTSLKPQQQKCSFLGITASQVTACMSSCFVPFLSCPLWDDFLLQIKASTVGCCDKWPMCLFTFLIYFFWDLFLLLFLLFLLFICILCAFIFNFIFIFTWMYVLHYVRACGAQKRTSYSLLELELQRNI